MIQKRKLKAKKIILNLIRVLKRISNKTSKVKLNFIIVWTLLIHIKIAKSL